MPFVIVDGLLAYALGSWKLFLGLFVVALLAAFVYAVVKQRDEARDYIKETEQKAEAVRRFKQECLDWCRTVRKFLEVRQAKEPLGSITRLLKAGDLARLTETTPELEKVRRETVSLYLEKYRDEGVWRFDRLVDLGLIVNTNRPKVNRPETPHDIWLAADSIETAAERLGTL